MTPSKPYLIRAIYEWVLDNNCTPYITADTTLPRVSVPQQYVQDNSITLDISPTASQHLLIDNEAVTFKARFGGIGHEIYVPIAAVVAIFAQETSQGMAFPKEEYEPGLDTSQQNPADSHSAKYNKPKLKVISGGKDQKPST